MDDLPPGDTPGHRLERAIRSAMARQGPAQTISALCEYARVNRGTLYDWFRDATMPSPTALGRIAKVIEVPIRDLWDAYEGREQAPTSTVEAIDRLLARLDRQSAENAALMRMMRRAMIAGFERAADEELAEPPDTPPPPRAGRTGRRRNH